MDPHTKKNLLYWAFICGSALLQLAAAYVTRPVLPNVQDEGEVGQHERAVDGQTPNEQG